MSGTLWNIMWHTKRQDQMPKKSGRINKGCRVIRHPDIGVTSHRLEYINHTYFKDVSGQNREI